VLQSIQTPPELYDSLLPCSARDFRDSQLPALKRPRHYLVPAIEVDRAQVSSSSLSITDVYRCREVGCDGFGVQ
jgi:hypothetical protein